MDTVLIVIKSGSVTNEIVMVLQFACRRDGDMLVNRWRD